MDKLIAEITIGETYFFRHQEHFDALRNQVLPDLISRNRAKRSLRIWCAGCADGPEPYSLAILLKREMAHQFAGWEVTILGTDINRRCLARARGGKFEPWALRSVSEDLKHACFLREGQLWCIAPEYKEWVSFQYHNLAEDHYPSLLNNLSAFDLIVCRNVMIYFGPDLMRRMIRQFHESLVPGAWLLVGPSEPNMTCVTSSRTVNAPRVTLYQKHNQPAPSLPAPDASRSDTRPSNNGTEAWLMLSHPPPLARPSSAAGPPNERAAPTLADVRHHADRGAWKDAARCCGELLEKDNLNSRVHFYHGLVLEQMRRHAEAEQSLRRAISLDRKCGLSPCYFEVFLPLRARRAVCT